MTRHGFRPACTSDLSSVNRIIERGIQRWKKTGRDKRLAMRIHQHNTADFDHMWMLVAEGDESEMLGVAALDYLALQPNPAERPGDYPFCYWYSPALRSTKETV